MDMIIFTWLSDQLTKAAFLFAMKLTTATISYHMQALIDVGMVIVEKLNNRLYFQVHEEHL